MLPQDEEAQLLFWAREFTVKKSKQIEILERADKYLFSDMTSNLVEAIPSVFFVT